MYDFIGDIHGYADELEFLLEKLGYRQNHGVYEHPTRKVFFLGDFIDRGPKIIKTLEIVRGMVERGSAKAIMANHEFNFLCFFIKNKHTGDWFRSRKDQNIYQIIETLNEMKMKSVREEWINWMYELPLWYEDDNFRVIHASWDDQSIDFLRPRLKDNKISKELVKELYQPGTETHKAIEVILKGQEIDLPEGITFPCIMGIPRHKVRATWWNREMKTTKEQARDVLTEADLDGCRFYPKQAPLVFFGHYWLKDGPFITAKNAQCLDWGIANYKEPDSKKRKLVAYRHEIGDKEIMENRFVETYHEEFKGH